MYIYDNKISMRIKINVILHINWLRMVLGNFKYTQWHTYNWVHHNNDSNMHWNNWWTLSSIEMGIFIWIYPLVNYHSYGQSHYFLGKSTINGHFHSFLYVYQSVVFGYHPMRLMGKFPANLTWPVLKMGMKLGLHISSSADQPYFSKHHGDLIWFDVIWPSKPLGFEQPICWTFQDQDSTNKHCGFHQRAVM
jgi:hypothetical protein